MDITSFMLLAGAIIFLISYTHIRINEKTITIIGIATAILIFPDLWAILAGAGFALIMWWWVNSIDSGDYKEVTPSFDLPKPFDPDEDEDEDDIDEIDEDDEYEYEDDDDETLSFDTLREKVRKMLGEDKPEKPKEKPKKKEEDAKPQDMFYVEKENKMF